MTFAHIQQKLLGKLTCLWKEVSLVPNSFLTFINNFQTSGAGKLLERVTELNTWGFVGCSLFQLFTSAIVVRKKLKEYVNRCWLWSSKTVFMVTDIWISRFKKSNMIFMPWNILFLNHWKMLKQFCLMMSLTKQVVLEESDVLVHNNLLTLKTEIKKSTEKHRTRKKLHKW